VDSDDDIPGMIPQVEMGHYFSPSYDSRGRWISYWHQIAEIRALNPESVLEIGIGNGLVASYLKSRGLALTTVDIDSGLDPDVVASLQALPFEDSSFDVVACFEVLEHQPWNEIPGLLCELVRVSRRWVVLSLPDCTRVLPLSIRLPRIGGLRLLIPMPRLTPPKHRFDGEHYWEIGKRGYSLRRIVSEMHAAGLDVRKTFRVFEMPYHRFFVLAGSR
jgi:SAM-dependent methyltransferase